jgi:hypothetical protein
MNLINADLLVHHNDAQRSCHNPKPQQRHADALPITLS